MPFFEKRKRKNDEKSTLWAMLMPILALMMVGAGLGLLMMDDVTEGTTASANVTSNQIQRIGLMLGHHHYSSDHGAVCSDGLTERTIVHDVAESLTKNLTSQGYTVDLFYDHDEALNGYRADLMLVLHTGDCIEGSDLSGYRIMNENNIQSLDQCLSEYESATGLSILENVSYMQWYPEFVTIAESTPVMLIEMGMPNADYDLLTSQSYKVIDGLANTLTCFSPVHD
jgi:hypothetical protein